MPFLLTNRELLDGYGERLHEVYRRCSIHFDPLTLPEAEEQRFDDTTLAAIELAVFTGVWEADPVFTRRFLGSCLRARNLRWLHLPNAGIDHPVFGQLLAQGVRLTTSSGATAEPIAQTAIAGLLALARGFPRWAEAQRQHRWQPLRSGRPDLRGQTMVLVGVGAIGNQIARLAQVLGLRVVGIRRSPRQAGDHVDEMHAPGRLNKLLPQADWLVLACPLTDETRHLIDSKALARLRPSAHVINVARGAVVDEAALTAALQDKRLAGAYLDVFVTEPLPQDSPLWDLPNVIVSPHDCDGSSGNAERISELFLQNLERWARGEALENEVK
ncbi:MAG: D-2-hydroxyacid dehydrogenase [Deltaproteobacteria bacterium]|nr:D-2-hydroxyacid dehydrogenase [Deltaproteobacteria bacterium]